MSLNITIIKGTFLPDVKQTYDIPLHDIKPLLEVQEYSLYYLVGLTLIALFLLASVVYFIYKWFRNRNKFNLRKEHLKLLNEIDVNDTKNAAYQITTYGYTFKDDSPRHTEMYKNLTQRLDAYKYKKNVEKFDGEVEGYIELYKGMIDG